MKLKLIGQNKFVAVLMFCPRSEYPVLMNYSLLVEMLPMNDAIFIAQLYANGLLPGDLKNQLNLPHRTSADKAVLFLDSVIEPSVTSDGGSNSDKLLNVMEDSEYKHLKKLAEVIRINQGERYTFNG